MNQTLHLHHGRGWADIGKDLAMRMRHGFPVIDIGHKHPRPDHIRQGRLTFSKGGVNTSERETGLGSASPGPTTSPSSPVAVVPET